MPYVLAPYIGTGTDRDPFCPMGSDAFAAWSSIDLRPERNVALLWAPGTVGDARVTPIGDEASETVSARTRNDLSTTMGRTVVGATVEAVVVGLASSITAQGPDRTGRVRVALGPLRAETTTIRGGSAVLDDEEHLYQWWRHLGAPHGDAVWLAARRVWPIGGGAALATDNFNRADSATLGANWTKITDRGHPQVVSNHVAKTSGACGAYYSAITWPNDQYSQLRITAQGRVNPGVRIANSGAEHNAYLFSVTFTGSATRHIREFAAGVGYTDLTSGTVSVSTNDVLYMEVQGSSLTAKVNGSTVLGPASDASFASGNAGLDRLGDEDIDNCDDFEGGDFAAAGRTTKNTRAWPLGVELGMGRRMPV